MALRRDARPLMGTVFSVAAPETVQAEVFRRAWAEALALLDRIEEIYSPFIAASPVSRIRDGALRVEDLDAQADLTPAEAADFREVLGLCAQLHRESGGGFDAWSVGAPPAFDPSGAVKGWAAERASVLLAERGVPTHLLNAGGDVRLRRSAEGATTWNVGVEDPHKPDHTLVTLALADGAVATSGTRQRGSHVWDPLARRPAQGLAQVTVVGPDLALADGYATAALALGAAARPFLTGLGAHGPYQGCTVDDAQGVWWSEGFERYAPALRGLLRPQGPDRPEKADFQGTSGHPGE
ncbi:MAG TPA: FAD:protein FMN transferase [Actinospica sp.]|nr:FAD:protein FMN transferase [Actinospica sp.]